jgi:glutamate N-acetyltransferase / amino-acid N-acetyltransferase
MKRSLLRAAAACALIALLAWGGFVAVREWQRNVLLLANRQAEAGSITPKRGLARFQSALDYVTARLAREIARDGEGATKLVEIRVLGAATERDALKIARTIANSPLVKTALAGGDPNWGRVLAAAGRAGVRFRADLVELRLGDVRWRRPARPRSTTWRPPRRR